MTASNWDERKAKILAAKALTGEPDLGSAFEHSTLNNILLLPGEMYGPSHVGEPDTNVVIGSATSSHPLEISAPIGLSPLCEKETVPCMEIVNELSLFCAPECMWPVADALLERTAVKWRPDRSGVSLDLMRAAGSLVIVPLDVSAFQRGSPSRFPGIKKDMDLVKAIDLLKEATAHKTPVWIEIPGRAPSDEIIDAVNAGADAVFIRDGFGSLTGSGLAIHSLVAAKEIKTKIEDIETKIVVEGDFSSSLDVLRLVALGADAVSMSVAPFVASGFLDHNLARNEDVDLEIAGLRLSNFLKATVKEVKDIISSMGKNGISEMSVKDLAAADYSTAAVTGLPLRGHEKKLAMWMH